MQSTCIKPLPDAKSLALSNLEAFAFNNFSLAQMVQKYIEEKVENAYHQHFILFPQCYQKASCPGSSSLSQGHQQLAFLKGYICIGMCEKLLTRYKLLAISIFFSHAFSNGCFSFSSPILVYEGIVFVTCDV